MLWHVFRYRDNRNRNRRAPEGGGASGGSEDLETDDGEGGSGTQGKSRKSPAQLLRIKSRLTPVCSHNDYHPLLGSRPEQLIIGRAALLSHLRQVAHLRRLHARTACFVNAASRGNACHALIYASRTQ